MDIKILKQIKNIIDEATQNLATRDEVKRMLKDETQNLATRDEVKRMLKDETQNLATRDDLNTLEKNLKEYTDQVFGDLLETVEKRKADKVDLDLLQKKVTKLQQQIAA